MQDSRQTPKVEKVNIPYTRVSHICTWNPPNQTILWNDRPPCPGWGRRIPSHSLLSPQAESGDRHSWHLYLHFLKFPGYSLHVRTSPAFGSLASKLPSFLFHSTAQPMMKSTGCGKSDESKHASQLRHLLDVWSGGQFYFTTFSFNFLVSQTEVIIVLTSKGRWADSRTPRSRRMEDFAHVISPVPAHSRDSVDTWMSARTALNTVSGSKYSTLWLFMLPRFTHKDTETQQSLPSGSQLLTVTTWILLPSCPLKSECQEYYQHQRSICHPERNLWKHTLLLLMLFSFV